MILNDKPNWQVSRILTHPHPIFSIRSETDPTANGDYIDILLFLGKKYINNTGYN
jgi:hypothetical protein